MRLTVALSHESNKDEPISDSPSMLLFDIEEKEWSWTSAQQDAHKKLSHFIIIAPNLLFLSQWQLTFASCPENLSLGCNSCCVVLPAQCGGLLCFKDQSINIAPVLFRFDIFSHEGGRVYVRVLETGVYFSSFLWKDAQSFFVFVFDFVPVLSRRRCFRNYLSE
jgi:hypothetical protein